MKTYYLSRNTESEAFAVFETDDGAVERVYPHTDASPTYAELEALIAANDPAVVYCELAYAESLPWAPPAPLTPEQLLDQVRSQRAAEYPSMADYLDGIVKGDTAQVQAYIDACLAVKAKYPKPA